MILNMDCRHGLAMLPDNSVDAIVCDPPYGLRFMGKKWDYDVPGVDIWVECLRVLKPGGHLLAFAGTRTQHRMAVRIEDAGFEIRDMIAWVYGSGFPKHRSSLKPALEPITMARKPAERATLLNIDACRIGEPIKHTPGGLHRGSGTTVGSFTGVTNFEQEPHGRYPANLIHDGSDEVVAMFPDSAGSGGSGFPKHRSSLKPALEPITMARKPAERATLLNIDACRVATDERIPAHFGTNGAEGHTMGRRAEYVPGSSGTVFNDAGRYPANLIHDGSPEVLAMFPDSAGSGGQRAECQN